MVLSDEKKIEYMKRLLLSRMRIVSSNGFYGLLLMHMLYTIDEQCDTASTDGKRIYFGPKFLDELSDSELDFIMMHEILHVVLRHCLRQENRDHMRFNIACDIVVNSNILKSKNMNETAITLKKYGVSMHIAPNGKEGYEYTAEQVYDMLQQQQMQEENSGKILSQRAESWDDHSRWRRNDEDNILQDVWIKRFEDVCEAVLIRDPSNSRGILPLFAERMFKELKKPQIDWRQVLNEFVQEEIVDYSFSPPDRRYDESAFFLPAFNDTDIIVKNILFMIDTSGSMSDQMITDVYSEVKGAIDQFDGKLQGWLGFFDAGIVEPKLFISEEQFRMIRPAGGGGTNFHIIFKYVQQYMRDNLPSSIIILTDGYAPFPDENMAMDIPVLWVLNNEDVDPPWGKSVRIDENIHKGG